MKNLIYKQLCIQVISGMISLPALATMNSQLVLSANDNSKFTLGFDNNFYTTPSNTYNVTNVIPGPHHVRMMSAPVQTYPCALPRLLFDGWITVPENSKVTAHSNEYLQMDIVNIVSLAQQIVYVDAGDPNGGGNYYGNYGNGYGNSSGYTNYNYDPYNYYPQPGMNAADFETLKNSIRVQSFDSNKLTIAEQAAGANHMTAAQVLEIVQLMDFESTKLDLAKFAYGNTADRNNYYKVDNAFSFGSSVDDLADYINNYHA